MKTNRRVLRSLGILSQSLLFLILLMSCTSRTGTQSTNPPVIPDAATARDFTLTYLNRKYGLSLPDQDTTWEQVDLITDPDSPSGAVIYSNSSLFVTITYPKADPAERLFNLTIRKPGSEFSWNGLLSAAGQVTEITVELATATPSATPTPTSSQTPLPTQTPIPTATLIPSLTPSPAPTRTDTPTPDPCNWASFVADITIPDGTSFAPGTDFVKIWRIKNVGSCTWTPDYDLVFVRGDRMDAPQALAIPREVRPGDTIDLAVSMRAPQRKGEYRGFWMLRTPFGEEFGLGTAANLTFWVSISVVESFGDFRYDFSLSVCSAIWRSAAGRLTCTNTTDDPNGYVRLLQNPVMENGTSRDDALWLHPNEALYGWIDGTYPYFKIDKGDRFRATVGCLQDYGACNLNFYLDYEDEDGRINRLGRWQEIYDGEVTRLDIDLSSLVGRSVRFILGVEANIQDTEDAQGFWLLPRIENP